MSDQVRNQNVGFRTSRLISRFCILFLGMLFLLFDHLLNNLAFGRRNCTKTKKKSNFKNFDMRKRTTNPFTMYPVQNTGFLNGSGYIHDCRKNDTKRLFSRQPFPMPKSLYTRLPCIKYKNVIYTAAVFHSKRFIYTAAVH